MDRQREEIKMLSYEEVLRIARTKMPDVDGCTEFEKVFLFYKKTDEVHFGGADSPVVIDRANGDALNYGEFFRMNTGEEIRDFDI